MKYLCVVAIGIIAFACKLRLAESETKAQRDVSEIVCTAKISPFYPGGSPRTGGKIQIDAKIFCPGNEIKQITTTGDDSFSAILTNISQELGGTLVGCFDNPLVTGNPMCAFRVGK